MEALISIYKFDEKKIPEISQVGGKGYSLIKMTNAGLNVPPGFVLSVEFFKPWINTIKSSEDWKKFFTSTCESDFEKNIISVKNQAKALNLNNEQKSIVDESIKYLDAYKLFAVRSSSPEEDLEGASFAGGYETILGVVQETIYSSIKSVFASCLDFRVFKYKKEKG